MGGGSLVIVLFAFGSLQYAKHPEGILEFQKRRSNQWFEQRFFPAEYYAMHPSDVVPDAQWLTRPLLSLRNVSKSFGGIHAVNDISFDVACGGERRPRRPERSRQDDPVQLCMRTAAQ